MGQPEIDMGLSVSLACVTRGGARPRGRLVLTSLEIVVCVPLRAVNHCALLGPLDVFEKVSLNSAK